MVKKIGKILIIILAVASAVSLFVGVWYFYSGAKGTFNSVTITDKNDKESMANPDLPFNTFEAGESIQLSIWVNGTDNWRGFYLLHDQVTLSVSSSGGDFIMWFDPSEFTLLGDNRTLTIATFKQTPQGTYKVTVIGTDSYGVEHQDSYSFVIVS